MTYFQHMYLNFKVSIKCFYLMVMHFLHGVFPCKYTSHEYYEKKQNKGTTPKLFVL